MRIIQLATIVLLIATGCGRKNPVQEVSVKQSGIELGEVSPALAPGDWNQWRGPTNDGQAADQELATTWSDEENIVWRREVPGRGHGSPIVVGDAVYLATALEDSQQQQVISFDRATGEVRWTKQIHEGGFPSKGDVHQKATNANGTIACDGQRLFIGMLNSAAILATAVDLNGEMLWQKEIGKFVSKFGYAPSPVLYKSLVIFAADNRGGGYITAVDGASGEIAWRTARGHSSSYSSPAVANVGGRDQLLISGDNAICSYDPATGTALWKTECLAEATCGTVVASDELIFAAGGYPDQGVVCLSAEGQQVWSNETKVYEPSLLVVGEQLIGVNDDGIAFCWEAKSGELRWKKRLGGNFSASPVLCNQQVFVSNLSGDTFVFTAGDEFQQVAQNRLGSDCYASPAISSGQLFLRIGVGTERSRQEQLVCIGRR